MMKQVTVRLLFNFSKIYEKLMYQQLRKLFDFVLTEAVWFP